MLDFTNYSGNELNVFSFDTIITNGNMFKIAMGNMTNCELTRI